MDVVIRKGREEDVSYVLALVRELAEFEKAPEEVEVTEEEMKRFGFSHERVFEFFVAEKQGVIVGAAIYYFKYSTWKGKCLFLEDLIITERERCKGYGSLLMKKVIGEAKRNGLRRVEWQVLNWNTPAIEFYRQFNASIDSEWLNGRLTPERYE
jgi:GNAT superfamily N-acetyltransferase